MAEFLVHLYVRWPADGAAAERAQLMGAEVDRRSELIRTGRLLRLWRDPGQWANWTLWNVADATELHSLLESLPFYPWMTVAVHPLARHEADPGG
jgi:muconolactone D-isomerase